MKNIRQKYLKFFSICYKVFENDADITCVNKKMQHFVDKCCIFFFCISHIISKTQLLSQEIMFLPFGHKKDAWFTITVPCAPTLFLIKFFTDYANFMTSASSSFNSPSDNDGT